MHQHSPDIERLGNYSEAKHSELSTYSNAGDDGGHLYGVEFDRISNSVDDLMVDCEESYQLEQSSANCFSI